MRDPTKKNTRQVLRVRGYGASPRRKKFLRVLDAMTRAEIALLETAGMEDDNVKEETIAQLKNAARKYTNAVHEVGRARRALERDPAPARRPKRTRHERHGP